MAAGELDKAEARFTDFVLLYPDYPGAWVNLAIIHAGKGDDEKARWAIDGALAWSFHAAPADRRLMAYGRLESVWPVHGNVLVMNDRVYTVAGRNMYTDGGLRFLILDAGIVTDNEIPVHFRNPYNARWFKAAGFPQGLRHLHFF